MINRISIGKLVLFLKANNSDVLEYLSCVRRHLDPFITYGDFQEHEFSSVIVTNKEFIKLHPFPDCISTDQQSIWRSLVDGLNYGNYAFFLDNLQSGKLSALIVVDPTNSDVGQMLIPLLLMANWWHIHNGHLCVHSSAFVGENSGFLFLGQSGSGKSTVVKLINSLGLQALGDDLNYIIQEDTGSFSLASAPNPNMLPFGYSLAHPKLRYIFKLVKDENDFIIPLSVKDTTKLLVDGFGQTPKSAMFPNEMFRSVLNVSAEIARIIPGYELHFRKSPDFWQLIDEQFPD